MSETLFSISADSHIAEPGDCYTDRIDPAFRDRAPFATVDDEMGAVMVIDRGEYKVPYLLVASSGRPAEKIGYSERAGWDELHPGAWDPVARVDEQERDGVAAEVLYPSFGMLLCNHPDVEYKHACLVAYNEWIAEYQSVAPDRLLGLGQTALRSVKDGIADLERIKELGLHGVMLPGHAGCDDVGDFDDPRWDPLWQAAIDLDLPLSFHILTTSGTDVNGRSLFRGPKMNSFQAIIRGNQDIIGTLIFGGVFDRKPELRVVCAEADAGWVPHWMYRADHAFERHRNWLTVASLDRMPSEYFRENVYVTFQDDWVALQMTELVNRERLLWASDHPHVDSTFPESQAVLARHTAHLEPAVRDEIVWGNCARLYGIEVPAGV